MDEQWRGVLLVSVVFLAVVFVLLFVDVTAVALFVLVLILLGNVKLAAPTAALVRVDGVRRRGRHGNGRGCRVARRVEVQLMMLMMLEAACWCVGVSN